MDCHVGPNLAGPNKKLYPIDPDAASATRKVPSGEFQIRINRRFCGLNRCFVRQSVRSKTFGGAPGMMHILSMGLSQRISAEGATYVSLGQRPHRYTQVLADQTKYRSITLSLSRIGAGGVPIGTQ
jgi:hypothetical protein